MASVRERILAAIVAALEAGAAKPPGLTVHRERTRPIEQDQLPAAVVYAGVAKGGTTETVSRMDHDEGVERALTVRVELRATGHPPDQQVDPLYVWVIRTLRADPTLGGLARDLAEQSVSFDADERDQTFGAAAVDLEVTYATQENDPEANL